MSRGARSPHAAKDRTKTVSQFQFNTSQYGDALALLRASPSLARPSGTSAPMNDDRSATNVEPENRP